MNGVKLLLDTNATLYFLGGDLVLSTLLEGKEIYISAITEMELLGYPNITQEEEHRIKFFLHDCTLVDINKDIKEKAIFIRKRYNLKLPDAIIAATSLQLEIALLSADGIFNRVEEINFVHYAV